MSMLLKHCLCLNNTRRMTTNIRQISNISLLPYQSGNFYKVKQCCFSRSLRHMTTWSNRSTSQINNTNNRVIVHVCANTSPTNLHLQLKQCRHLNKAPQGMPKRGLSDVKKLLITYSLAGLAIALIVYFEGLFCVTCVIVRVWPIFQFCSIIGKGIHSHVLVCNLGQLHLSTGYMVWGNCFFCWPAVQSAIIWGILYMYRPK